MTRPRGEGGAKFVLREQRKRDRLREETQGLADKRGRVRAATLYKFMLAKPGLDEMRKSG